MIATIANGCVWKNTSQFLTPEKISEVATRLGLSTEAALSPGEYNCLQKKCVSIALENLHQNIKITTQIPKETIQQIVNRLLEKQCKTSNLIQEDMPQFMLDCCTSILWKITSLFYSNSSHKKN
ncbi:MAG: hypothetical protein P0S93_03920 [Candidatus Neptunochlamydia sp.]|nr:hypothetical protein [Candidatus Neptunochlamydia sp.]